jgi:uncharacterized membrane protein (UPF0127 family)
MTELLTLTNQTHPDSSPIVLENCNGFFSRLAGLMFRKTITPESGIVLSYPHSNRVDSSIHMFFMNFDIAVIWVDESDTVVDTVLAKKWKPFYAPTRPACRVIETHPARLADYHLNDRVKFSPCANSLS